MTERLDWAMSERQAEGYDDSTGRQLQVLSGLGSVNIFVGANSVGKSRMLRRLFAAGIKGLSRKVLGLQSLNVAIAECQADLKRHFRQNNPVIAVGDVDATTLDGIQAPSSLRADSDSLSSIRAVASRLAELSNPSLRFSPNASSNITAQKMMAPINDIGRALQQSLKPFPHSLPGIGELKSTYIPVLRSLRSISGGLPLRDRTIRDYFPDMAGAADVIYTGESLFAELRSMLLGSHSERTRIRQFEKFLSRALFGGDEVELIPRESGDVTWVKLGKRPEREIYNLGDGIQHAIILMFPFFARPSTLFFVEEPELHLHPGMQRRILEAFYDSRRAPGYDQNRLFLTTHSNHLLDMSLDYQDMAVYRFTEGGQEMGDGQTHHRVERVSNADHGTLEVLGVRKSSVLLVNATLWVEGISERWFFRRLIDLVQSSEPRHRRLSEDVHFSFVEYAGANIIHYAFVQGKETHPIEVSRLCGRALVIADWDEGAKDERLSRIEAVHGTDSTIVIREVREVENLLSPEILRRVISGYEGVDVNKIPEFGFEAYQHEYLGSFIENLLVGVKRRTGSYAAKSGTIAGKVDFWRRALEHLDEETFDSLPQVTKDLAVKIVAFIARHNAT